MRVCTAPEQLLRHSSNEIRCFLAGGISNCPNWQKEVIDELYSLEKSGMDLTNLVILNPRRDVFKNDQRFAYEQVEWEFNYLESCDIFSMYFCGGESVQPICLYELGRNLVRMQQRFPETYAHRILVSVEPSYSRAFDVIYQTDLASITYPWRGPIILDDTACYKKHAEMIASMYERIKK